MATPYVLVELGSVASTQREARNRYRGGQTRKVLCSKPPQYFQRLQKIGRVAQRESEHLPQWARFRRRWIAAVWQMLAPQERQSLLDGRLYRW